MRICVVGAGAIGGLMATRLSLAGNEVAVVDQGKHLEAIRKNGLTTIWEDGTEYHAPDVAAHGDCTSPGEQDIVILGVKAQILPAVAPGVSALFGPDTAVLTVQNGLPWWYFQRHGGGFDGTRLQSLDPDGVLEASIPAERIVGCVVYPAGAVTAPGVIKHVEGDRYPIGELDGAESGRVQTIHDCLVGAGFSSRILDDIRAEIWLKAWGNLSFNPISALTHATLEGMCQFPETRLLAQHMMEEAQTVANRIGIEFRHTIERRIAGAESVGPHKTSMLQDVEAGRALEVEALIGSIIEIGRLVECPTPHIDAVYACVKLLDKVMRDEGRASVLAP